MATVYPGALDALPTNHNDSDNEANVHAALHNDVSAAINAIEAELGTLPKGSFASVKARLAKPDAIPFVKQGTLTLSTGSVRFVLPYACTIVDVRAIVNTQPTGASIKVDVNKNGTTIFTTQANRPNIAVSTNLSGTAVPDVTALAAGDYLTVDVDQIGSTIPGADLTVVVTVTR